MMLFNVVIWSSEVPYLMLYRPLEYLNLFIIVCVFILWKAFVVSVNTPGVSLSCWQVFSRSCLSCDILSPVITILNTSTKQNVLSDINVEFKALYVKLMKMCKDATSICLQYRLTFWSVSVEPISSYYIIDQLIYTTQGHISHTVQNKSENQGWK